MCAVLTGCGTTSVPLNTQPDDANTAEALAATIADIGHCDHLENVSTIAGQWMFTCDRHSPDNVSHSFGIKMYADLVTKQDAAARLRTNEGRYKEGSFFHVMAAQEEGQPRPAWRILDGFPGEFPPQRSDE